MDYTGSSNLGPTLASDPESVDLGRSWVADSESASNLAASWTSYSSRSCCTACTPGLDPLMLLELAATYLVDKVSL